MTEEDIRNDFSPCCHDVLQSSGDLFDPHRNFVRRLRFAARTELRFDQVLFVDEKYTTRELGAGLGEHRVLSVRIGEIGKLPPEDGLVEGLATRHVGSWDFQPTHVTHDLRKNL